MNELIRWICYATRKWNTSCPSLHDKFLRGIEIMVCIMQQIIFAECAYDPAVATSQSIECSRCISLIRVRCRKYLHIDGCIAAMDLYFQ